MKAKLCLFCLLGSSPLFAAGVTLPEVRVAPFSPPPPALSGPALPAKPMEAAAPSLAAATNAASLFGQLGILLTDEQRAHLNEHGFVLLGLTGTRLETEFGPPTDEKDEDGNPLPDFRSTPDEMLAAFDLIVVDPSDPWSRTPGQAKLITPDLALHAFHRFFSQALEYLEQRQLRARLEVFLGQAMASARRLREGATPEAAARLEVVEAQLAAAWCALGRETKAEIDEDDVDLPDEVRAELERANPPTDARTVAERLESMVGKFGTETAAKLKAEVEQILKAEAGGAPGLFLEYDPSRKPDYSQFRPRSHYTKSEELRGYFRAMMFLGRNGYALRPVDGPPTLGLTDAMLLSMALSLPDGDGRRAVDTWRELMEITGFFAGPSDDLTFIELRDWLVATLGRESLTTGDALDPAVLDKLQAAMAELRAPRIIADERGRERREDDLRPEFRIFGQRFSFDAWVLNRLVTEKLTMPTGLFIPAAFGDAVAEGLSKDFIRERPGGADPELEAFGKTLAELRATLEASPDALWFGSMAGQQLHAASMLAGSRNENFPRFMRGPAFARKNLESILGHWTEIKHDTVLYAKQSYAEAGEGGDTDKPLPPMPRGFVQPDVPFWREMERLADFTRQGVERHSLLPGTENDEWAPLVRFHKDMTLCRTLAEKEVRGEKLSNDENEAIWTFSLSYMDAPLDPYETASADRGKSALVTDVHTDGYRDEVLQEALGRPSILVALVGNERAPRLVAGLAYQHFEFVNPKDQRATDEEWRAKVYASKPELPPRAKWVVPVFPAQPDPKAERDAD